MLIDKHSAKARFMEKQEDLFTEVVSNINTGIVNGFNDSGLITISVEIPEVFHSRIQKLFAESKDWNLVLLTKNSIQVRSHG